MYRHSDHHHREQTNTQLALVTETTYTSTYNTQHNNHLHVKQHMEADMTAPSAGRLCRLLIHLTQPQSTSHLVAIINRPFITYFLQYNKQSFHCSKYARRKNSPNVFNSNLSLPEILQSLSNICIGTTVINKYGFPHLRTCLQHLLRCL